MVELYKKRVPSQRVRTLFLVFSIGVTLSNLCAGKGKEVEPCLRSMEESERKFPGGDPASLILSDLGLSSLAPDRPLANSFRPEFEVAYSSVLKEVTDKKLRRWIPARRPRVLVLQDDKVGLAKLLRANQVDAVGLPSSVTPVADLLDPDFERTLTLYEEEIFSRNINQVLNSNYYNYRSAQYELIVSHRVLNRLTEDNLETVMKQTWNALVPGGLAIHTLVLQPSLFQMGKQDDSRMGDMIASHMEKILRGENFELTVYLGKSRVAVKASPENAEAMAQEAVQADYDDLDLQSRYEQVSSPRPMLVRIVIAKTAQDEAASAAKSKTKLTVKPVAASGGWSFWNLFGW